MSIVTHPMFVLIKKKKINRTFTLVERHKRPCVLAWMGTECKHHAEKICLFVEAQQHLCYRCCTRCTCILWSICSHFQQLLMPTDENLTSLERPSSSWSEEELPACFISTTGREEKKEKTADKRHIVFWSVFYTECVDVICTERFLKHIDQAKYYWVSVVFNP